LHYAWFDGATYPLIRQSRIGYVITDADGNVVCRYGRNIEYHSSPERVELFALRECLTTLISLDAQDVVIHGDCQHLIYKFYKEHRYRKLKSVYTLLERMRNVELVWVPRKENRVAHEVCRLSRAERRSGCVAVQT
jgi:ribonuclease HI